MVGAVIVKDGKIIGEGWHKRCGDLHAERNAFKDVLQRGNSAEGATLYVTLEPCCHHGRTAPCTEAIIENRIKKVVIGSSDPNPKVSGKGVRILRDAGIEVVENFMKEQCDALNPVFFHYITTKTPYVILKYAMTLDGKVATKTGASKWISCPESLKAVHRMRHDCTAIMAGIGTVLADDPLLNCRIPNGRNPVRIICDTDYRLPADSQIAKTARLYRTIVLTSEERAKQKSLPDIEAIGLPLADSEYEEHTEQTENTNRKIDLKEAMKVLGAMEIDSILLEGGPGLAASALKAGIVNEIRAFVAPKIFGGQAKGPVAGEGVSLPDQAYGFAVSSIKKSGDDVMLTCVRKAQ